MEKPEVAVRKPKKVMLVIENVGEEGFKFDILGDIERLDGKTPTKDLSPAEFWGLTLFRVCNDHLQRHGDVAQTGGPDGRSR